jgi:hypothetical protein
MTQLLQKYLDYLPAHIPNTYPVTKLQDRLKIHYGDSIVVQIQRGQGKSNLVFSSDVSIGHVATAGNLKSKLKTSEIKQEISIVAVYCNDGYMYLFTQQLYIINNTDKTLITCLLIFLDIGGIADHHLMS